MKNSHVFTPSRDREICALCGSYMTEKESIVRPSLYQKNNHMEIVHRVVNDASRAELVKKYFVSVEHEYANQ